MTLHHLTVLRLRPLVELNRVSTHASRRSPTNSSDEAYFAQPDLGRSMFASASLEGPVVIQNKEPSLGFVYIEF